MDSVNSPLTSAPIVNPVNPEVQPVVQEAQAAVTVPNQGSPKSSKALIGLLIFAIVAVLCSISYFLYVRSNNQPATPTSIVVTPVPTKIMVSPTTKNEVETLDQIDTSFPSTDAASIQSDLQGL
ncbi:MAG: hypothetical protein WBO56_03040 [Microgenomates group bacterium]|jgi:flagellar basal body-associated protein FliL|nr:hypothetical protein [Candidatus Woesebacteria bacterium]